MNQYCTSQPILLINTLQTILNYAYRLPNTEFHVGYFQDTGLDQITLLFTENKQQIFYLSSAWLITDVNCIVSYFVKWKMR